MKKISFLYLKAFNGQGGLEKFNRAFMKAMSLAELSPKVYSVYDRTNEVDTNYYPVKSFSGFVGNPIISAIKSFIELLLRPTDVIFIGHLNLAPIAYVLKLLRPFRKTILMAHGIEVWGEASSLKIGFLKKVDQIWAVSNHTSQRLIRKHPFLEGKVKIFPNTLDPFFPTMTASDKSHELLEKNNIASDGRIILTVARLTSAEGYKGYDRLVEVLSLIDDPKLYYLIVGKYDEIERERIVQLAKEKGVADQLRFCGFVSDKELYNYYQLADVFVMPSLNEGFGIVFIESLACGTPVIAGNQDGSVDALMNGELGTLVDPNNLNEIAEAINAHLMDATNKSFESQENRIKSVHLNFGFPIFQKRLLSYLNELVE